MLNEALTRNMWMFVVLCSHWWQRVSTEGWEKWPNQLDVGIYWFGPGNHYAKHHAGEANAYFDPRRPTAIYFHGWERNSEGEYPQCYRETFNYKMNDPVNCKKEYLLGDSWLAAGWNLGVFYWDQYSDDDLFAAEAKIWSAHGPSQMNYRVKEGRRTTPQSNISVAEIAANMLRNVGLGVGQSTKELRLVGHSLGGQLVVRTAFLSMEKGNRPGSWEAPVRVTMLDPYFSSRLPLENPQAYLPSGTSVANEAIKMVKIMHEKKVVFELLKTSELTEIYPICDPADGLFEYVVYARRYPDYCYRYDQHCRHLAAPNLYFLSMSSPPPPVCTEKHFHLHLCSSPSPRCSTEQIRHLAKLAVSGRRRTGYFVQYGGQDSIPIDDDCFDWFPPRIQTASDEVKRVAADDSSSSSNFSIIV